eukprot:2241561-Rhodomonas_salina.3
MKERFESKVTRTAMGLLTDAILCLLIHSLAHFLILRLCIPRARHRSRPVCLQQRPRSTREQIRGPDFHKQCMINELGCLTRTSPSRQHPSVKHMLLSSAPILAAQGVFAALSALLRCNLNGCTAAKPLLAIRMHSTFFSQHVQISSTALTHLSLTHNKLEGPGWTKTYSRGRGNFKI